MSRIVGIVHVGARPFAARECVVDMLGHGASDVEIVADHHIALGVAGARRVAHSFGGPGALVRVALDGEIRRTSEFARELALPSGSTDEEHVVEGYERYGAVGVASRLDGSYAFCIWDQRTSTLWLARDRFGMRPLYFVARATGLAFASSLRALARSGLCLPKIDEEALWGYLLFGYCASERTLLAGALRVRPGHVLEWRAETGTVLQHRSTNPLEDDRERVKSVDAASGRFRDLLSDSLDRSIGTARTVGCLLSERRGTYALAALGATKSANTLRTYTVASGVDGAKSAERVGAFTESIGARHTAVVLDTPSIVAALSSSAIEADEPRSDSSSLAIRALASAIGSDVECFLASEGSGELLGDHPMYTRLGIEGDPEQLAARAMRAAASRVALTAQSGRVLPPPRADVASPLSGVRFLTQPEFILCLLVPDRRPSVETFRAVLAGIEVRSLPDDPSPPFRTALSLSLDLVVPGMLARRFEGLDTASATRIAFPFFDRALANLALSMSDDWRVAAGGRMPLAEALSLSVGLGEQVSVWKHAEDDLGIPLDTWLRGPLRDYVRTTLQNCVLVREGLLAPGAVEAALLAHNEVGLDLGRLILALVNLDAWWSAIKHDIERALPADGALPTRTLDRAPTVDILIPIFESFGLVRDCIQSIRANTRMPFRALLLDDASCTATHEKIAELVGDDPRFVLVRNETNLGFLRNCLRGFDLSRADYVVLLNSDTVVTPEWLERLVSCAESDPRIAAVNPLTNESGNTSVRLAPGLTLRSMAQRIAERSECRYPDLTTGVGMCMLIRRSALDLLGGFDTIFDHAYCEESDLCMRFTEAGLRVVAADDCFIYHKGWASYDEAGKSELYLRNRRIFDERWAAAYERDWAAYTRRDPLQYIRDALLRDTVAPVDVHPARRRIVEERLDTLETIEVLAASDDCNRAYAALALLPLRAPTAGREEYLDYGASRTVEPVVTFHSRAAIYPTRRYVSRLPKPDSGRLRITFLASSLPLSGGVIALVQLANEMLAAGHDVKIVTEATEFAPESLNLWLQPLVYRDRSHVLEAFPESDVVVATFWTTAHRYLPALRRRHHFTSVYFIQDYEAWFYEPDDNDNRQAAIDSYKEADRRIAVSNWVAEKVAGHGYTAEVVAPGVDLGIFYPRRNKANGRIRVVSVASPEYEKRRRGFRETVEIFRRVHAERPDVEFVFFGTDDDAMPSLPFPFTNAGRFHNRDRLAALISECHVLVDASHWQGFGLPGLEAMACGTVPVSTSEGGVSDYAVDGDNCLLVPSHDTEAAVAAILRLVDDEALRERLSAQGPASAARFSHARVAKRHLELYSEWQSRRS